jgi:hypothetical protein
MPDTVRARCANRRRLRMLQSTTLRIENPITPIIVRLGNASPLTDHRSSIRFSLDNMQLAAKPVLELAT